MLLHEWDGVVPPPHRRAILKQLTMFNSANEVYRQSIFLLSFISSPLYHFFLCFLPPTLFYSTPPQRQASAFTILSYFLKTVQFLLYQNTAPPLYNILKSHKTNFHLYCFKKVTSFLTIAYLFPYLLGGEKITFYFFTGCYFFQQHILFCSRLKRLSFLYYIRSVLC